MLSPDGLHCTDVNECLTPANNCKFICKNTIGSFTCGCPEGFTKIPMTDDCQDINECATNNGLCQNGYCVNLRGGYRCDCFDGFQPSADKKKCIGKCLLVHYPKPKFSLTSFDN